MEAKMSNFIQSFPLRNYNAHQKSCLLNEEQYKESQKIERKFISKKKLANIVEENLNIFLPFSIAKEIDSFLPYRFIRNLSIELKAHKEDLGGFEIQALENGKLLSVSFSCIKIWDLKNPHQPYMVLQGEVYSEAIIAETANEQLAVGTKAGFIEIWALDKKRAPMILFGHTKEVEILFHIRKGRKLASAVGKTIKIWNLKKPKEKPIVLPGHKGSVSCMNALEDGRLVSAGTDGAVIIWDLQRPGMKIIVQGHTSPVRRINALKNNRLLTQSGKWVHKQGLGRRKICDTNIWDVQTCKIITAIEDRNLPIYIKNGKGYFLSMMMRERDDNFCTHIGSLENLEQEGLVLPGKGSKALVGGIEHVYKFIELEDGTFLISAIYEDLDTGERRLRANVQHPKDQTYEKLVDEKGSFESNLLNSQLNLYSVTRLKNNKLAMTFGDGRIIIWQ